MRALLCACLFLVACKGDKATSSATEKKSEASQSAHGGAGPGLPDTPESRRGERPHLANEPEPRDWNDPEMRERMAERREAREKALDTNGDGVVSPEERQARLEPMVKRLDTNGDGKLTTDELAAAKGRMQFDPAAVDTDHNGEISLSELDAAVTARREEMRAKWRGRGSDGSGQ